jgi:hypothetical protein
MSAAWIALALLYAVLFLIVVWPIHWMWHHLTQQGRYDRRFYGQWSYWRLYLVVYGTAIGAIWLMGRISGGLM